MLEKAISACYQASLLREEERPVTFQLVLTEPERCPSELGPPGGLHRLEFAETRPFDEHELRRLSPAADFHRSLIGAAVGEEGRLRIWSILQSGPRWVRSTQGGREQAPPLPPVAVIHTKGPGRVAVHQGDVPIASLDGGRLMGTSVDVFASRWLPEGFASVRAELMELHESASKQAKEPWRRSTQTSRA